MDIAVGEQNAVEGLRARWQALRTAEAGIRARDAADRLGVSEAKLLAARCGQGARRLDGPWGELIQAVPALNEVMALTRNDSAVHEKVGSFGKISILQTMGLVLNQDIDLRLFLNHWHFGFALREDAQGSTRHSLQFFDIDGAAVHKIYLRPGSDADAYETLVRRFMHADQSGELQTQPPLAAPADRPDDVIDRRALWDRWQALQDVHDFHAMLQDLGVGRAQALRLVGGDFAYPVRRDSFRTALERAAGSQLPIMIFAGSPGVIQIHTGPVRRLKEMGPWFNVLDPGFNLHLRQDQVAGAWIVRKPTREGIVTSLEIFDAKDRQIAWMFGERGRGEAERADWRQLAQALTGEGASA